MVPQAAEYRVRGPCRTCAARDIRHEGPREAATGRHARPTAISHGYQPLPRSILVVADPGPSAWYPPRKSWVRRVRQTLSPVHVANVTESQIG